MKTLMKVLITVAIVIGIFILGRVTSEKDPAYWLHPAMYYGRPAFTQLHRFYNGVQYITFYRAENAAPNDDFIKDSKHWVVGPEICRVPTELAISMYHAQPGYPK